MQLKANSPSPFHVSSKDFVHAQSLRADCSRVRDSERFAPLVVLSANPPGLAVHCKR